MFGSEVREGMVIRLHNQLWRAVGVVLHKGAAKSGSMVHLKLRNLATGSITETRIAPDEKVDALELTQKKMQFLYADGEMLVFADPETYDQISLPRAAAGPAASYLKEGMELPLELSEGRPISLAFPKVIEMRIAQTGPGLKGQGSDTVWKDATLENGLTIRVPQMVETGDLVRVEVETSKYLERVQEKAKGK